MKRIIIGFEVHQPFRVRRDFFWNPRFRQGLEDRFFDTETNREIFERIKKHCYIPATNIILESIEKAEEEGREVKYFFSISGTFLEQAERWGKDVIELFQQLSYTHKVEFLAQTYYHSITSLWEDKSEWREQVKMHKEIIKSYFREDPITFENTELITNKEIIEEAERMGFKMFISEGTEKNLKGRSPNYVYRLRGHNISLLFRNFRLSDDIAFRFSKRDWDQYPLTASKFADWISISEGNVGLIFVDYETFGEHHKEDTGILHFLRWLPIELGKRGVEMTLPREVYNDAYNEIDIEHTTSWADIEKNEKSWLGNIMQWAYDDAVRRAEMPSKELGNEYLKVWRYFTTSDNYYYLFLGSGGPAEVHSYFNAFGSPIDAFINEFYAITVFLHEELAKLNIMNEPYIFTREGKRASIAWNYKEFMEIIMRDERFKDHMKHLKEWLGK
ncbi:alpha-amylase [Saccharolobus caldissimus]|uniref:Alpha-amylase n=1 Tax=Saccharolobus caldissimus TaxID=1702097 RepID=A0AAQ4CPX6_9CREN|nr:glycoside hydrolase family 57 protein [Saccharolobus caldissimus]BDB97857.1 alpha-amylase [Saccharolobus caldissimus]